MVRPAAAISPLPSSSFGMSSIAPHRNEDDVDAEFLGLQRLIEFSLEQRKPFIARASLRTLVDEVVGGAVDDQRTNDALFHHAIQIAGPFFAKPRHRTSRGYACRSVSAAVQAPRAVRAPRRRIAAGAAEAQISQAHRNRAVLLMVRAICCSSSLFWFPPFARQRARMSIRRAARRIKERKKCRPACVFH